MNKDHSFKVEVDVPEDTLTLNPDDFVELLHTIATYCLSQAYGILTSKDDFDQDQKGKSKIGTPFEMLLAHAIAAQEVRDEDFSPLEVKLRHSIAKKWVSHYFMELAEDDLPPEEILGALLAIKAASKRDKDEAQAAQDEMLREIIESLKDEE